MLWQICWKDSTTGCLHYRKRCFSSWSHCSSAQGPCNKGVDSRRRCPCVGRPWYLSNWWIWQNERPRQVQPSNCPLIFLHQLLMFSSGVCLYIASTLLVSLTHKDVMKVMVERNLKMSNLCYSNQLQSEGSTYIIAKKFLFHLTFQSWCPCLTGDVFRVIWMN
jgi:hypothetical protein